MITRTFITYDCTATVIDKTTHEVSQDIFSIPMASFNKKDPAKSVAKVIPADKILVSVDSIDKAESLMGITEEDFLAHAVSVTRPASQTKKSDETVNA